MSEICRIVAVLGTRPEAIKLALVIHELKRRSNKFETAVVYTGQHRSMLDQALRHFNITPDFDLDVMRPNQSLSLLTGRVVDTVENADKTLNWGQQAAFAMRYTTMDLNYFPDSLVGQIKTGRYRTAAVAVCQAPPAHLAS